MSKRITLILMFLLLQTTAFAAVQMKVAAISEFRTDEPTDSIDVSVLKETELGKYIISINSTLHCRVMKIVDPKRGKRNATFFVQPMYYIEKDKIINIEEEIYGRYSKHILSKEELKKIPSYKVMKIAALAVGNYFITGFSTAYSFGEGVVKNEQDNRLKSGVVNAYESSPLSLISKGEQLDIRTGDDFYLIFKTVDDDEHIITNDLPNEVSRERAGFNENVKENTNNIEPAETYEETKIIAE